MTQAGPVMGHCGRAGNRAPRPTSPLDKPDVAALLGLAAGQPPPPPFALPGVEAGHPEERLAVLAAGVTGLAADALAFLAREAACEHLAESLWQRITALEDAPALRAPARPRRRPRRSPARSQGRGPGFRRRHRAGRARVMAPPLPFPPPAVPAAPVLASAPARSLADLAQTLDAAQRALRALEDHARGVPGVLAARVRDCAAGAADAVEAHGYDLFLAANGGAVGGGEAIGDAGGEDGP